ncbi:RNA-directed DNA polymerase-like protein [Gossypium australe]|uniref:RNA-directed DNA polymerase-like protein n=1 Tax=Gossypium australe TaxID=47621 RepID=A0A5B6WSF1_9ROSI|nr:RNA-directed DNA polymerase-like protein [Gossypium australe]
MDYLKLNKATCKDHFPLLFKDKMLDRLVGKTFYCFLDAPTDQEKITFTCSYGTFAFRQMPFGLCNAPATFQLFKMVIFSDMVEKFLEVFMDNFLMFGDTLKNLKLVFCRCEETNPVLNWEKCHFMVCEGIVLGHKISQQGITIDKAKIAVIEKLPPPTTDFIDALLRIFRKIEHNISFKFDESYLQESK